MDDGVDDDYRLDNKYRRKSTRSFLITPMVVFLFTKVPGTSMHLTILSAMCVTVVVLLLLGVHVREYRRSKYDSHAPYTR